MPPPPQITVMPPDPRNTAGQPTEVARVFVINRDGSVADMGNVASGWSGKPLGYQQLDNMALVYVCALAVPTGATRAMIQNNGVAPARWRDDAGGDPSATMGQRIAGGDTLDYRGDLNALRVTREGDGCVLDILFYA